MYLAARLARLARQWIKKRSISCFCEVWGSYIYRLVWLASASKNPSLSVGFMYLAARLAQQWIKERSKSCFCEVWGSYIYRLVWLAIASKNPVLSVGSMYLAAHLARQWIKERNISCFVKCGVHIYLPARLARLARQCI